jgi:hypothetical protein
MGLDTVELVMFVEDEFQITIPNDVAPTLGRLGDLSAYVVLALRQRSDAVDPGAVWDRLKQLVIREFAIPERIVTPEAHIAYDLGLD